MPSIPTTAGAATKGYPTRDHRIAIRTHGLTPYHRLTFNHDIDQLTLPLLISGHTLSACLAALISGFGLFIINRPHGAWDFVLVALARKLCSPTRSEPLSCRCRLGRRLILRHRLLSFRAVTAPDVLIMLH